MRTPQLESMLAESGLAAEAADELRAALAPLQQPDTAAPAPSEALAALFPQGESASAPVGTVTPIRARGRRAVSGALVLALASVGATGLSAAANTLPTPWQHQVSEFAHRYLPFDLPEPRLGPPRQREPLSGAGTPRTTAGTLVPSRPHARQAPRDDAPSTTVVVPRERLAKATVADATVARTPRSAQVTTTRSSTRWEHSVAWSAPAPAPTSPPTSAPTKSAGTKSTGPKKSSDSAQDASKDQGKDQGKDAGKGTGSKSANPQDPGEGEEAVPTASPLKGQAPVLVTGPGKGPVSGPVEGPSTGPVIEAVRGSGGKGGPGDVTSGPGDTVETGPDAPRGPDGKPDKTLGP